MGMKGFDILEEIGMFDSNALTAVDFFSLIL